MDWVSIVVTVVASGLAVALAELMFRGKSRGAAYLVVVLVLVGISNGVARQVVSPLVRGWQADKIFREVPAFAAIERLEPAAAAELKKVARSGNMAELRLRARQQIVRMLFKYGSRSSDPAIVALFKASIALSNSRPRIPISVTSITIPHLARAETSRSILRRRLRKPSSRPWRTFSPAWHPAANLRRMPPWSDHRFWSHSVRSSNAMGTPCMPCSRRRKKRRGRTGRRFVSSRPISTRRSSSFRPTSKGPCCAICWREHRSSYGRAQRLYVARATRPSRQRDRRRGARGACCRPS